MKKILCVLLVTTVFGVTAPLFAQAPPPPPSTDNHRVIGTIDFIRTFGPDPPGQPRFEVRIKNGACGLLGSNLTSFEGHLSVLVRSGRLDGDNDDVNGLAFRNAFTIALVAFLTGQTIQIDSLPSCELNIDPPSTVFVQTAGVGISH